MGRWCSRREPARREAKDPEHETLRAALVPVTHIVRRILVVRGQKVMIDADLCMRGVTNMRGVKSCNIAFISR